ncbi:efflux RND transporter periplasmic adaptor subunit [Clostridium sp. AWRP]|uniref:HlyD family secretion protein n=1 Tax=Clostridium sp. AWRP TaxID=2212991 RepID=UPI000FD92B54|nr:efflux RND transporter periplasmic adaptor subunit [Clostridium sp. AWRP]AZV55989.1 efflux RND transporter periplasmic adaptor subunit [Clostridium sp. AWRP]
MKKLISILLICPLLLIGCSSHNDSLDSSNKKNSTSSYQDIYLFGGKIAANTSSNVSSKINAKISQIKVDVGSKVNSGDPIIYLDTKDLQAQVDQAQASVATAQANLAKIKSGSRPEQIASTKAAVDGAKDAYDIAQKNYNREKQLLASGSAAQINVDQAEQVLSSAKAQYESVSQNLTMLQNGSTESDINAVAATVNQAQASVNTAKTSLSYGVITAPISGTVSVKNVNEGEMSGVGQILLTIVNADQLHVDSYVPQELLTKIKVGDQVNVKVSNINNGVFQGEISVIDTQIDSRNKDALVKVTIKDGNNVLKPGMFAEIGCKNKVGVKIEK